MIESTLPYESEDNLSFQSKIESNNTYIGYDKNEIAATPTEELIILKRAIYSYLKSPTLKNKNPNYLKVFKRMNEELKTRKDKDNYNNKEPKIEINLMSQKKNLIFFTENINDIAEKKLIKKDYIAKKRCNTINTEIHFDIPSFLQDKSQKNNEEEKINSKLNSRKSFDIPFDFEKDYSNLSKF